MNTFETEAFLDELKLSKLSDDEKNDLIKKFWNEERQREYNEALKLSKSSSRVPYNCRKKEKNKDIKNKAITTILAFAIATGISYGAYQEYKTFNEKLNIEQELGQTVRTNKSYGAYDMQNDEYNWWYSDEAIDNIINSLQNNYPQYDIDTKIYCCYKALPEYNKKEYLDKIVSKLTEYESFLWYLNSKGLTEAEYVSQMEEILRSYAKSSLESKKRETLFEELNPSSEGRF